VTLSDSSTPISHWTRSYLPTSIHRCELHLALFTGTGQVQGVFHVSIDMGDIAHKTRDYSPHNDPFWEVFRTSGIFLPTSQHGPLLRLTAHSQRGDSMTDEEKQPQEAKQPKERKKRKRGGRRAHGTGSVFQRADRISIKDIHIYIGWFVHVNPFTPTFS
jgi:hypothetical protein